MFLRKKLRIKQQHLALSTYECNFHTYILYIIFAQFCFITIACNVDKHLFSLVQYGMVQVPTHITSLYTFVPTPFMGDHIRFPISVSEPVSKQASSTTYIPMQPIQTIQQQRFSEFGNGILKILMNSACVKLSENDKI